MALLGRSSARGCGIRFDIFLSRGGALRGSLVGRTVRGYDAAAVKFAGPCGGSDRGLPVICRSQQGTVGRGGMFVLRLQTSGRDVLLAGGSLFGRRGPSGDPARAAVIADAIHGDIVDHGVVVGVVHDGDVHVGDRAVIDESAAAPLSTRRSLRRRTQSRS